MRKDMPVILATTVGVSNPDDVRGGYDGPLINGGIVVNIGQCNLFVWTPDAAQRIIDVLQVGMAALHNAEPVEV